MPNNDIWFEEVIKSPLCNDEQLRELGEFFLAQLKKPEKNPLNNYPSLQGDTVPRIVFISLSQDLTTAKVYRGEGQGLIEALEDCYSKFQLQLINNKTIVKIDVVCTIKDLGIIKQSEKIKLQYTLEGIGFSKKIKFAILPEQIFSHRIYDQKQNTINYENIYQALTFDPLAGTQLTRLLKWGEGRIYRFNTKSIMIKDNKIQVIYRGKRITKTVSLDDIKDRLKKAAFYLVQSLNKNGQFDYIFYPDINSSASEYNIVRHAGTLYAMLEYHEHFPNQNILEAANRGLNFLFQQMLEGDSQDSLCVLERGYVTLGAVALSAVALAQYLKAIKNKKYLPILLKLGTFILDKIQENGQFKPQKQFYLKNIYQKDTQSLYYPGEATLALLRIYSLDKNIKWLKGAEKAVGWLINVRDKDKIDLYPDHWLLYTLNELYQHLKNPIYLEHTEKLSHSILTTQIDNSPFPDWNGGYYSPPRSTPTATRGEGLSAAYQLFKKSGKDEKFLSNVLDVYRKIILFAFGTQYLEESVMFFSNPSYALGGFHGSHTMAEIRIDYVQHNISSLLGYYKIITERKI